MTSNDLLKIMSSAGKQDIQRSRLATIDSLGDNGEIYLKFYGEETASQKSYKRLSTYTPAVGDTVMVANINGSYVVTGGIV